MVAYQEIRAVSSLFDIKKRTIDKPSVAMKWSTPRVILCDSSISRDCAGFTTLVSIEIDARRVWIPAVSNVGRPLGSKTHRASFNKALDKEKNKTKLKPSVAIKCSTLLVILSDS